MTNVNEGHRSRLRKRMMKEGLQSFQDHEVLELLLFQYLPRKDTNKIAHDLLNKFGSFANVLEASPEQLITVNGISESTACNLAVLKEVWQRYRRSAMQKMPLGSISEILKYSQEIMSFSYEEKLVVAYLDGSNNLIVTEEFTSRNTHRVDVDLKELISSALRAGASGVILFHCHVNGVCKPSAEDKKFTEKVFITLANMNIVLLEHIIFNNGGQYYSFFKEGELQRLALKYNKINEN
ncbi:MAG: DNA repair protein RadC [Corallococcus sp.]|nr:DNA repair protein RadC [Corallococcus sp.]MCM1359086.1 DNA repair protein RadC [Corallococcus sp.]MCM1395075.1 DNA repair protein RadC [Corallococcus sp.]